MLDGPDELPSGTAIEIKSKHNWKGEVLKVGQFKKFSEHNKQIKEEMEKAEEMCFFGRCKKRPICKKRPRKRDRTELAAVSDQKEQV